MRDPDVSGAGLAPGDVAGAIGVEVEREGVGRDGRGLRQEGETSWHEPARQTARGLAQTPAYACSKRERNKTEALFSELKLRVGLLKNRLHSILHHCLTPLPEFDLFSKRGIAWLRELPLPEEEAQARDSDLRLLEQTELEIAELEKRLVREAWQDDKVRLVMSIPGIDYTVAQTCLAAIGDVARFSNAKKLAAYFGFESIDAAVGSALLSRPHHRTRERTRTLAVGAGGAASGAVSRAVGTNDAQDHPEKKSQCGGGGLREEAGGAAVARADEWRTVSVRASKVSGNKICAVRVRATGRRRRGGVAKDTPRSARYGQGRTRAVPSLPQVLAQNGLPEIAPLAPGEKIMLEKKRLHTFYRELQTPSRIEVNTRTAQVKEYEEDATSQLTQS